MGLHTEHFEHLFKSLGTCRVKNVSGFYVKKSKMFACLSWIIAFATELAYRCLALWRSALRTAFHLWDWQTWNNFTSSLLCELLKNMFCWKFRFVFIRLSILCVLAIASVVSQVVGFNVFLWNDPILVTNIAEWCTELGQLRKAEGYAFVSFTL